MFKRVLSSYCYSGVGQGVDGVGVGSPEFRYKLTFNQHRPRNHTHKTSGDVPEPWFSPQRHERGAPAGGQPEHPHPRRHLVDRAVSRLEDLLPQAIADVSVAALAPHRPARRQLPCVCRP